MSEIVRALEGPIAPMICATEGEMETICDRLDGCSTHFLWARVRDAVSQTLDAISLADLLQEADAAGGTRVASPHLINLTPPIARRTPASGESGMRQV